MGYDMFEVEWHERYVESVRAAASVTYERTAGGSTHEAYMMLAGELQRRGIEPDPEAVYEAAVLISQRRLPAILWEKPVRGRHTLQPVSDLPY